MPSDPEPDAKHLTCSEVWGGFETVDRPLQMPGLEGRVYSRPFNSGAGGDVHYVSSCATGVYSRILLADVSGHGREVSEVARRLQQLMRRHIGNHSQGRLVRRVNREFASMTDAGTFATAIVMTYDSKRKQLIVSNAGHPPPLLYRAATREWSFLKQAGEPSTDESDAPEGLPLGIEPVSEYRELEYALEPGDVVLCYTDWLTEARNTVTGELLGFEGLLGILRATPIGSIDEMIRGLLGAVTAWTQSGPSNDDVTLLAFRASGTCGRTSPATWLMAPFRMTRTLMTSLAR